MNQFNIYFKETFTLLLSMIMCVTLMGQGIDKENPNTIDKESISKSDEKRNKSKKIKIPNLLFTGTLIQNQEKKQDWYIPSLFEFIPPNTIEGFVVNPKVSFTQYFQKGKFINFKPNLRYGFGNKRFQAQLSTQLYYAPSQKASIQLSGGSFIEQFNEESTLNALNNTLYTFLRTDNFLKIYEKSYLEVTHTVAPIKDFLLTTTLSWNNRSPLQNLSKYDKQDSKFTSNTPINDELLNTEFDEHQALLWNVQLRWQLGHQYIRQRGAFKSFSYYPAITIEYSGSLPDVLGSDLSYQKIALRVSEIYNAMKWGTGHFLFEIGDFISRDKITFIDFKHFNGKRTIYGNFDNYDIGDFQLLDYYQYSTTNFYLQGHYEHQWNGLTNKNKSSLLKPVVAIHYLYTPAEGSYWEVGIGLNKLLKFWRVDFYNSWRGSKHESYGVRFGVVLE
ncbi:MAG: DUF5686 family protein [Saprospiraceae bacterium]